MRVTNPIGLIEPSFEEAIRAIEGDEQLPLQKRRHWTCSLRVIAKMLGRHPELVAARWTAVRGSISRLHHSATGVERKTLANHKANARAALAWFTKTEDVPRRGASLRPDWTILLTAIKCVRTRRRLYSPLRYWSARGTAPDAVDEDAVDAYMRYRADSTALSVDAAARRGIARTWNGCVGTIAGWPARKLEEPACKETTTGPRWEAFPAQLQADVDVYLSGLRKVRKSVVGRRYRPCSGSTIKVRRARLVAFARKAVAKGVPIEKLSSLRNLLSVDVVGHVLHEYWPDREQQPSVYVIDLVALLVSIVCAIPDMDETSIAFLDDLRAELEGYRGGGLTEKNLAVIRQVMTPGIWARVVALPTQLMREAREYRSDSPIKAAVLAQMACAIGILTIAPVRLGNLAHITLDTHLFRPGGPDAPYWLVFPHYDVKNRMRLEFEFDQQGTGFIAEYVNDYLPILRRGSNELRLFPGAKGGHKQAATLSLQITKRIQKGTGLRLTVHQFRHAAAALILQAKPGDYEFVRRVLGHKKIQTTINFYVGLETTQATRLFADIVRKQLDFAPEPI